MKSIYQKWLEKILPEALQKRTDDFANAVDAFEEEKYFRAGFYLGRHFNELVTADEKITEE